MNKLIKVCIALAAFAAFAVLPAVASAENDATVRDNGVDLAVGSNILATDNDVEISPGTFDLTGETRLTAANKTDVLISCTTNELTGTLTKNTHTEVAGEITAANFKGKTNVTPHTTHCTGSTGDTAVTALALPYCLQIKSTAATDTFNVRGGKCTEAAKAIEFTFTATTILGQVHCIMHRPANEPITGTYTTTTTPAFTVKDIRFTKVATNGLCPDEGFLDMKLALHTDPSGNISIINAT
jgi:hypothetical protein